MPTDLAPFLTQYGYLALLPLTIVEGPAVTVFAAFLAAQGVFDVVGIYLVAVLGDLLGDLLWYAAGRWLLQRVTDRRGRWATHLRRRVGVLAPRFRSHAATMLLVGKLTHAAGFAVLLAAGAAQVRLRPFLLFNLLGTLPKALVLVLFGYWFGRLVAALQGDLRIAGMLGFVLASSAVLLLGRRLLAAPAERGVG